MSWRDGFTEQMFIRFQHIIDFVCTQLHSKKTTKKNIDEVYFLCLILFLSEFCFFIYLLGISYSPIFS